MADVIVYGFPVSTYVDIVRLVLAEKGVPFRFHDVERDMGRAMVAPHIDQPVEHARGRVDGHQPRY